MKTKNGFTIIEVVLVLAIAGLIFLATFIALPNLWASQRDSARKENIMTFVTRLKNYQTNNNRGALPGTGNSLASSLACTTGNVATLNSVALAGTGSDQQYIDADRAIGVDGQCVINDRRDRNEVGELSWAGFYRDYMTDSFEDPGGYKYDLYVIACEDSLNKINVGANCNNGEFVNLNGMDNINKSGNDPGWMDHTLYVATSATCDGNTAVKSLNSRNVAVVYKLERTGQFCYNS